MSGLVTPASIGLTDSEDIEKLLKRSKLYLGIVHTTSYILCPTVVMLATGLLASKYGLNTFLLFGIPWVSIYTIGAYFICTNIYYEVCYFYIICEYLRLKLANFNEKIKKIILINRLKFRSSLKLMKTLDLIYAEIEEYNSFWCKFSLLIYICYVSLICTLLYSLLFGNLELLLKIMIGYVVVLNITIFVSLVIPGVLVTREVNKSYLLFNKLFVSTDKSVTALAKLKVISLDNYLSFKTCIKTIFALFIIFLVLKLHRKSRFEANWVLLLENIYFGRVFICSRKLLQDLIQIYLIY